MMLKRGNITSKITHKLMISFFGKIFSAVTTTIFSIAVSLGLISAPVQQSAEVINKPTPIVQESVADSQQKEPSIAATVQPQTTTPTTSVTIKKPPQKVVSVEGQNSRLTPTSTVTTTSTTTSTTTPQTQTSTTPTPTSTVVYVPIYVSVPVPVYVPPLAPSPTALPTPPIEPEPPAPTPTPAPQPQIQAKMNTLTIFNPIATKGIGKRLDPVTGIEVGYRASAEVIDESNYVYIGAILRDASNNNIKTATVTVTATDASQNKTIVGTGTLGYIYVGETTATTDPVKTPVYYYPFTYNFKTAGQHTITFSADGADDASVNLTVN